MLNVNRINPVVTEVFNTFKSLAPSLICAGGAIRDSLNFRNIKDIDLYIHIDDLDHFLKNAMGNWVPFGESSSYGVTARGKHVRNTLIDSVYVDNRCSFGYEVQLIVLNIQPIVYVKNYFDLGICKVWMDNIGIHTHPDYINDITQHSITVTLTPDEIESIYDKPIHACELIESHIVRVSKKYQQFKKRVNSLVEVTEKHASSSRYEAEDIDSVKLDNPCEIPTTVSVAQAGQIFSLNGFGSGSISNGQTTASTYSVAARPLTEDEVAYLDLNDDVLKHHNWNSSFSDVMTKGRAHCPYIPDIPVEYTFDNTTEHSIQTLKIQKKREVNSGSKQFKFNCLDPLPVIEIA